MDTSVNLAIQSPITRSRGRPKKMDKYAKKLQSDASEENEPRKRRQRRDRKLYYDDSIDSFAAESYDCHSFGPHDICYCPLCNYVGLDIGLHIEKEHDNYVSFINFKFHFLKDF